MVSNFITMKRSAHPCKMKMTVLGQEVIRRMRNTGRNVPVSHRVAILNKFMVKMLRSGYGEKERANVLTSGVNGYYAMLAREEDGGTPVNRDGRVNRAKRKMDKIRKRTNWFLPPIDKEDARVEKVGGAPNRRGKMEKCEMGEAAEPRQPSTKCNKTLIEGVVFIPHT